MFVTARGAVAALAAAAVLAGAAGCGGGGSTPTSLPSLTANTSASPAPSATGTAAELAAVSAVVRQYYSLLNGATSRANAQALQQLMTSTCPCQDVVRATKQAVARHETFFGVNKLVSVVPNLDGDGAADALVTYDYTRSGIKRADGHVVSSGPGRRGTTQDFRLVKRSGRWLIATIIRVREGTPV